MSALRFGTSHEPNLEKLSSTTFGHLESSEWNYNGFSFLRNQPFTATPEKEYVAVARAKATHPAFGPMPFGDLVILLLSSGNGTGNRLSYAIKGLDSRSTPRRKPEGGFEIVIPLGTAYKEAWINGLNHMEEVSLLNTENPDEGYTVTTIGTPFQTYLQALNTVKEHARASIITASRCAQFTQDSTNGFGNAHAIRTPKIPSGRPTSIANPNSCWLQVAGFLALPSDNPDLIEAARELTAKPALAHTVSYKP